MIQSLSLINLFVRNVQRSREFYADVLEIPVLTSDDQYVLLDIDGPRIYLHCTPPGTKVNFQHVAWSSSSGCMMSMTWRSA